MAEARSNCVAHRGQAARSVYTLIGFLLLGLIAGCGTSAQGRIPLDPVPRQL
jgi:hypothetical protein